MFNFGLENGNKTPEESGEGKNGDGDKTEKNNGEKSGDDKGGSLSRLQNKLLNMAGVAKDGTESSAKDKSPHKSPSRYVTSQFDF